MSTVAEQNLALKLNRPIVLVGLMGAGKTSVGRRIASLLDVPFYDSDNEIEAAAGMSIGDFFAEYGEAEFRQGEQKVIARLLQMEPGVVATGGGAFVSEVNRQEIAQNGISIWLDAELETLWDRVKDRDTRPLLKQENPKQILTDLLEKRSAFYAQAAIRVVSEAGVSHDRMVRKVLEAIRANDLETPERTPTLKRKPLD